jgi:hypothetical protein
MHLSEEDLSLAIQFPEQPRQVPVAAIKGDEREVQAFSPQAHHHVQGDLALGAERLRLLRHPHRLATGRLFGPRFRQIPVGIDHARHAVARHRREDADLTVIDLPQAPVPLPRHACGQVPLLPECALVQEQSAEVAEMGIGIDHQLPTHPLPIPIGFAQHVMQWLIAAVGYGFRHALHVTARALEQPVQLLACRVFYRTGPALKAMEIGREVRIEVL